MTSRDLDSRPERAAARGSRGWLRAFGTGVGALLLVAVGCGRGSSSDPFVPPRAGTAGAAGEAGAGGEGGKADEPADPTLGGPCLDDAQCDDGFECTADSCDPELARCRHVPSDTACDDGIYCNGVETCSIALGCRAGSVVSCSDLITCTIDTCIEETQSCKHVLRDADGDGDPAAECTGNDCDDADPYVSGEVAERCGNQRDDDCDGEIDESDCVDPANDRCGDALEIDATGSYEISLRGNALDYPVRCQADVVEAGEDAGLTVVFRDAVLALEVPEGEARDVSVVATVSEGEVVLAATERCGDAAGETECTVGVESPAGGKVARLYFHSLGEGAHAVYLSTTVETSAIVRVDFRPATPEPENETCGTAAELEPGVPVRAVLASLATDIESACPVFTGDLVYAFELEETSDVRIGAVALDEHGWPVVSLRDEACTELEAELTCRLGATQELFARALRAGRYTVGLFGMGPTEAELVLSVSEPSDALPGEGCDGAPELEFGEIEEIAMESRTDAVQTGCLVGAVDAAFTLDVPEPSDVMLVNRASDDDVGGLLLAAGDCALPSDALACSAYRGSVRTVARDVPEGRYRAVVESWQGNPLTLSALRRPAVGTVHVPLADECDDAVLIPEAGGRFEGTTRNAFADYGASCDYGGQAAGGAPDQMLRLELEEPRRMLFDMQESAYDTLLVIRDGSDCPGSELAGACAPGYFVSQRFEGRSFLDLTLPAGSYWVQIDGYDGDSGRWVLDVFSAAVD